MSISSNDDSDDSTGRGSNGDSRLFDLGLDLDFGDFYLDLGLDGQYDEKLHDALELEHIREFQSNIEENEIELEDEDDFWNRRSALIDHYIYNRDVLKTDFERHRSIT